MIDFEHDNKNCSKKEATQWHYLVKDPKDLPKKEGHYWVCVRDGRYTKDGSWEWTSKPVCMLGVWRDGAFSTPGGPPVLQWCELPTEPCEWDVKKLTDEEKVEYVKNKCEHNKKWCYNARQGTDFRQCAYFSQCIPFDFDDLEEAVEKCKGDRVNESNS